MSILQFNPNQINFGTITYPQNKSQIIEAINTYNDEIQIKNVILNNKNFKLIPDVQFLTGNINPNETIEFTISSNWINKFLDGKQIATITFNILGSQTSALSTSYLNITAYFDGLDYPQNIPQNINDIDEERQRLYHLGYI